MAVQYSFAKVNMTHTIEVKTKGSRQNKLTNRKERNSPVYIRQKRRDLDQIATEGFLGSS